MQVARYSLVVPIDSQALAGSRVFCELERDLRARSFAPQDRVVTAATACVQVTEVEVTSLVILSHHDALALDSHVALRISANQAG
jgi:hypothetical protein